jgi:hypothetical protein
MSRARLELLQWFGLLGAPLAWAAHLVLGYGLTQAGCGTGTAHWGVGSPGWQIGLIAAAATVAVASELAALKVFLQLRRFPDDGPPPPARMRFFAFGALIANVLFLTGIALNGIGVLAASGCRGA